MAKQMKTREIGIFTCGDCDGEGGWYEPHFFDGTPIENRSGSNASPVTAARTPKRPFRIQGA